MWQVVLLLTPFRVGLLVVVLFLGCCALEWNSDNWRRAKLLFSRVIFYVCISLVLVATLSPTQPIGTGDTHIWWVPGEGTLFGSEYMSAGEREMLLRLRVANAIMFTPLAISGRYSFRGLPLKRIVAGGCGLSFGIEIIQWVMRAGRTADVDDLLFNAAGACLGVLLIVLAEKLVNLLGGRECTRSEAYPVSHRARHRRINR
ncbi:VanZ family protein [Streptomyces sp. NPDC001922]|uniref:VanZ family protein n=1 Tax=Streptomyces sp. NPDC001922 TaxID=3364624 RepID=UPI00368C55B9